MKQNTTILSFFILLGIISLKTQCDRNVPASPDYKYIFSEEISVTPYQLDYSVGDTIWMQLNVPGKKLYDSKSNSRIYFDSAGIVMSIPVMLLFNNPYVGDGPFVTFVFPKGVSAYTNSYSGNTTASITLGCTYYNNYIIDVGVVLLQKGVFSIGANGNDIQNCYTGYASYAQLSLTLQVADTHKTFYQSLPFADIGKKIDPAVLSLLDAKGIAVINVQ